jgi:uncharacterized protein YybS (DUF2232 family)
MHPGPRLALAVAASSSLYAAGVLFPPLLTLVALVAPLPGLLLAVRAPRAEFLWLALSVLAISIALGLPAVLGFVLSLGLPPVILGSALRRGWSFERTVVAGTAAWCAGVLALSMVAYGDFPTLLAAVREQLHEAIEAAIAASTAGGATDGLSALAEQREEVVGSVIEILPALVALGGAFVMLVNLGLLRRWTGATTETDLRSWKAPESLIWLLIATGFFMFVPLAPVAVLARNVFVILLGCYLCQGLAIVSFYLHRFRLPFGIRIASYLLIAVQQAVTLVVLGLGIFDLWGDFRRLRRSDADVSLESGNE